MADHYTPEWSARHILWVVALIVLFTSYFDKASFFLSAYDLLGLVAGELLDG